MREAGRIVARVHEAMREMIRPGVTTAALDARAEEIIRAHDAIPAFLGYPHTGKNDFPASICASINEELVHGIPSAQAWLEPGDIISIDVGRDLQGWVGDSAWTYAGRRDRRGEPAAAGGDRGRAVGRHRPGHGRATAWPISRGPSRAMSCSTASRWCASTPATAWAAGCTRSRRCSTSCRWVPGAGPGCGRA